MDKKVFGLNEHEVRRQLEAKKVDVDPEGIPLTNGGTGLEACIEGGKQILSDPQTRMMLKNIYQG